MAMFEVSLTAFPLIFVKQRFSARTDMSVLKNGPLKNMNI